MDRNQFEAYVRGLCKDKNYDQAKTDKIVTKELARFDDPEDGSLFADLAELPIKSNADYNKKVDELKTKATTLDNWRNDAQAALDREAATRRAAEQRAAKYQQKYGDLDEAAGDGEGGGNGNGNGNGGAGNGAGGGKDKPMTTAEYQKMLEDRDRGNLRLIADLGRVRAQHAKRFKGEIIDDTELLKEVGKAAQEGRNITIDEAYQTLFGEKVAKLEADDKTAYEQKLRDEGAKAERDRIARAGGMRTGATQPEGYALQALRTEGSKNDKARQMTDDDRIAALAADIDQTVMPALQNAGHDEA